MFKNIADNPDPNKVGVLYPIPKDIFHLIANVPKKNYYETEIKNIKKDKTIIVLKDKAILKKV
uniref:Uncharacterized protein n=1 Tax=viral metagenome TaxID=1070528 RepID=A0A6C0JAR2_9ZZZZ